MAPFHVDPDAPAHARRSRTIAAPAALVWEVLSDLAHWPDWNPGVRNMRLGGAVAPGTEFRWTGGGMPIRSRLAVVEPPATIAWTGRAPGIRARHAWHIEAEGDATRVTTEEDFTGPLARLMPGAMTRSLERALDDGLAALAAECEARAKA